MWYVPQRGRINGANELTLKYNKILLDDLGGLSVITRVLELGKREAEESDQRWHPEKGPAGRRGL